MKITIYRRPGGLQAQGRYHPSAWGHFMGLSLCHT